MQPSARHQTAETRFRELVTGAGLEQPDGVDYEPEALVFRWSGPKVAVVVDLEPGADVNGAGRARGSHRNPASRRPSGI